MKVRASQRPAPDEAVRLVVDLPERGPHAFELPDWGTALLIHDIHQSSSEATGSRQTALRLMAKGYALGLCWAHEWNDLETEIPWNVETAEAQRVGSAVLSELQLAGYSRQQMSLLTESLTASIFELWTEEEAVKERVDFTEPEASPDSEPSTTTTSGSPSSETPTDSDASTESAA